MSIYAFSDLHGRYDLWRKIFDYIRPGDRLVSLGDNIDRGPDGIKIWKEIRDGGYFAIKGNHELMAENAIPILMTNHTNEATCLWFLNGGEETWKTMKYMSGPELIEWVYFFKNLEQTFYYENDDQVIILDHAGFTLGRELAAAPYWDRNHFYDNWPKGFVYPDEDNVFDAEKTIIVHGHTPVQYMYVKYNIQNKNRADNWTYGKDPLDIPKPNIIRYCNGHKIDIDLGSVASNRAALLNLNTLEVVYVEVEE